MVPSLLASVDGVTIIVTTAGNVPATAVYLGGYAITQDGKLYVVPQ